jgi:hypothetical protein
MHSHRPKTLPPVQLGNEFDLTFDLSADPTSSPARPTRPLGLGAFISTLPASSRQPRVAFAESSPVVGLNAPEVHQLGIVSGKCPPPNQPPVPMAKLSSDRANTARSSVRTQRPSVKPKMYVFGYREEAEYIPRPFISSHRPKVARGRAVSAREKAMNRLAMTFERPAKLSKRREVANVDFCHSIVIGPFQQFEQQYRGP